MTAPSIRFVTTTNIGSRDDDELKPRLESEYTTERQAIRKIITDYYSDKPFKDVDVFPAQVLKVIESFDIKKDNYLNNLLSGLPRSPPPEPLPEQGSPGLLQRAKDAVKQLADRISSDMAGVLGEATGNPAGFAGFGEKRYKVRVLDLDIALPVVKSEGDRNLNPLTSIPKDKQEASTIRDNLLIDYVYNTEFLIREGISCDVGDVVLVTFANKENRSFGIIEHKLTGAPEIMQTKESEDQYQNPQGGFTNPPPQMTPDAQREEEMPDNINKKWTVPLKGTFWITSLVGKRNDPWTKEPNKNHGGIDIAGAGGTPIYAVADGKIVTAYTNEENNTCGFFVVLAIKEGDKIYNITHCHLSRVLVVKGQKVNKGDRIGLMGTTGKDKKGNPASTGNHLHFQISVKGGSIINPYSLQKIKDIFPIEKIGQVTFKEPQ